MIEIGVARLDVPNAVVGIVIAGVVLLPEGLAALRAARANRLQTSLNLALGSALASIGLTIPAVAAGAGPPWKPPAPRAAPEGGGVPPLALFVGGGHPGT